MRPIPTRAIYLWSKIKKNYYDNGVRVFWLDEAEPEYGTYDFDNYRYHSRHGWLQTGNIYPQVYARTFYDGHDSPKGRKRWSTCFAAPGRAAQRYGALVLVRRHSIPSFRYPAPPVCARA